MQGFQMKVVISGAQSVGKTTLLNRIKEERPDFEYLSYITRAIQDRGFKINEAGTDETQIEMLKEFKRRANLDNVIMDRSILDGVVYTHYLYKEGQVSLKTLKEFLMVFTDVINLYDKMLYIKPEFDIVEDGCRSTNIKFRDDVVELFDYYIDIYNLDVIVISGTVEERVSQLLNALEHK